MKSFKLALLGATFLVGAAAVSGANAADVYSRGGGSIKDSPVDYMPAITWTGFYVGVNAGVAFDDAENSEDEAVYGLHAGYNWQKPNNFVLGIEGDVDFGDGLDYLASIRGRLGYAAGPTLLYATGGAAFIGLEGIDDDDSETFTGYVVGLGVEHKLRSNVSLGLEGLYYNFEDDTDVDGADFWTLRARATYHFSDPRGEPLK